MLSKLKKKNSNDTAFQRYILKLIQDKVIHHFIIYIICFDKRYIRNKTEDKPSKMSKVFYVYISKYLEEISCAYIL